MKRLNRLSPTLLGLALLGAVSGAQQAYDLSARYFVATQKARAVTFAQPLTPSATALRFLSLGNSPLAADVLWLDTIQYFGAGNPYGTYAALGPMLDRITTLDPQFEYPYEFGLVVLPYMQQSNIAATLGLRAQDALPNNGLLTYYLATVYHLNLKDYENAAKYYKKAADEPGAPGAARTLAGVALTKIDGTLQDRLVAIAYWQTVVDNARGDDERAIAQAWLDSTKEIYALENAAAAYKQAHGSYPASIQAMVDAKLVDPPPVAPNGSAYVLNPNTGRISY